MEDRTALDVPRDLREWIARAEAIGQIQRIRQPVARDEMGAITYMAHQTSNAPAPLFESIEPGPFRAGHRGAYRAAGDGADQAL
jgi:3-polyprenyl-4-hydroxybenzoate decarboxylase